MREDLLTRARLVAEKVHAGKSYDIYPYMKHILDVVKIASNFGYDDAIRAACFLHDSMEDGDLSYNDIKKHFGEEVAEIVFAVSDESGRTREEKHIKTYPKILANEKAVCVKLCDRIANMKHSYDFNPKLFEMYIKEHTQFFDALYNPRHREADRAWVFLKTIIEKHESKLLAGRKRAVSRLPGAKV
jgi:(p)ppGpp synthase/HD superfamily hydrolase